MNVIIGIEQLSKELKPEQIEQLESAAASYKSQSNIEFTILQVVGDIVQIETAQFQTRSGKYANEATLIKKTNELFSKWMPGHTLKVDVSPFLPSPTSVVTPQWLEDKMKEKGVRIKQIAFDTGVNRDSVAEWVAGKRSMSQIVKAMFYFYLSK